MAFELPVFGSNVAPLQEYLLQGSFLDSQRENVIHRVMGICDVTDTRMESFHFKDHEMVFIMRGNPGQQPVYLRVRRSLEHSDNPWHLRYIGNPDMGDKSRHTLVRSCVDVGTSENVVAFLQDIGFKIDHEFMADGYMFRKGRMKVIISKIYKMNQPGNLKEGLEMLCHSHLLELSIVAAQGQEKIQEDMKNFAEQLKPAGKDRSQTIADNALKLNFYKIYKKQWQICHAYQDLSKAEALMTITSGPTLQGNAFV